MLQYYHPDDYNCLHCYLVKGRLMESLVPGVEGVKVKPLVVDCESEIYASPSTVMYAVSRASAGRAVA